MHDLPGQEDQRSILLSYSYHWLGCISVCRSDCGEIPRYSKWLITTAFNIRLNCLYITMPLASTYTAELSCIPFALEEFNSRVRYSTEKEFAQRLLHET